MEGFNKQAGSSLLSGDKIVFKANSSEMTPTPPLEALPSYILRLSVQWELPAIIYAPSPWLPAGILKGQSHIRFSWFEGLTL